MRIRLGLLLPLAAALLVAGCGTGGKAANTADVTNGKKLFSQTCASCHVLADANAQGRVGPSLDDSFAEVRKQGFHEDTIKNVVLEQIRIAELPMPANLVRGKDAQDVASYVAAVAGTGKAPTGTAAGANSGGTDGKSIFASAGCGGCHTLKDAGSSGTIGPNLDDTKPSLALAITRVTNGKAPMPAFKGQLTDAQIKAVAKYVTSVAGK